MELDKKGVTGVELPNNHSVQYLENGKVIWQRDRWTNKRFAHDGTLLRIKAALLEALDQIDGQLTLHSDPKDYHFHESNKEIKAQVIDIVLEDINKRGAIFRALLQQIKSAMSRFGKQL